MPGQGRIFTYISNRRIFCPHLCRGRHRGSTPVIFEHLRSSRGGCADGSRDLEPRANEIAQITGLIVASDHHAAAKYPHRLVGDLRNRCHGHDIRSGQPPFRAGPDDWEIGAAAGAGKKSTVL